jgi:hypothetical protein
MPKATFGVLQNEKGKDKKRAQSSIGVLLCLEQHWGGGFATAAFAYRSSCGTGVARQHSIALATFSLRLECKGC